MKKKYSKRAIMKRKVLKEFTIGLAKTITDLEYLSDRDKIIETEEELAKDDDATGDV